MLSAGQTANSNYTYTHFQLSMSAQRTYPQALDTQIHSHTYNLTLTVLILNRKPGKPKKDGITESLLWYKR